MMPKSGSLNQNEKLFLTIVVTTSNGKEALNSLLFNSVVFVISKHLVTMGRINFWQKQVVTG